MFACGDGSWFPMLNPQEHQKDSSLLNPEWFCGYVVGYEAGRESSLPAMTAEHYLALGKHTCLLTLVLGCCLWREKQQRLAYTEICTKSSACVACRYTSLLTRTPWLFLLSSRLSVWQHLISFLLQSWSTAKLCSFISLKKNDALHLVKSRIPKTTAPTHLGLGLDLILWPCGADLHNPSCSEKPKNTHHSTPLQTISMNTMPYLTFAARVLDSHKTSKDIFNKPYKTKFLGPLLWSSSVGKRKKWKWMNTVVTKAE